MYIQQQKELVGWRRDPQTENCHVGRSNVLVHGTTNTHVLGVCYRNKWGGGCSLHCHVLGGVGGGGVGGAMPSTKE